MPCTYTETPDEIRQAERKRLARRKTELNKVTRLLCSVMSTLYSADDITQIKMKLARDKELQSWWDDHKKRDDQAVKEKALKKLTPEEKKALGLTK